METIPQTTGKFALRFGLILGAVMIVFSLMLFLQDMHTTKNTALTIISIILMAAIIFFGIWSFRKANGGFLSIAEGLKVGLGATALASVLILVYQVILMNVLDPQFVDKIVEANRIEMTENGLAAEQIDQQTEMTKKYFWVGLLFIMVFNIFIGFVISLISGFFLKKSRPDY